jgi:HK97 family phage major capsid protein
MPEDQAPKGQNQYRSLQEMEDRLRSIRSELASLDDLTDPTPEELNWQGTLISEFDDVDAKAEPLRKRMADLRRIEKRGEDPENREEPKTAKRSTGPDLHVRNNRDPLADLDRIRQNLMPATELRSRAADLIEQDVKRYELSDEFAENASVRVQENVRGKVAQHILMTGTREYRDAFRSYMESGVPNRILEEHEQSFRAINLTNASGGYLLPYILDPTIVLTNNASANPFRRVSRVVQTTSNAWQGVNSAGVTAAWIGEATTASDMSPTVGQIQIVPQKGVAWVLGSYEALDDTDFGQQLPNLLGDARDRLESAAFATGSGTAQPLGVIAALGTGSRVAPGATGTAFQPSTATSGTGGFNDVLNLQAALPPRFRNSSAATFMANISLLNKVRALDSYGGGAFWTNLTSNTPAALVGQPIYEASDMNSVTTGTSAASGTGSATLLFGDFSQFIIADRVGVSMLYEPMVKGSGNAQLPTGQAGWYMFWRTSSAVSTTAAFRYLTIS